MKNEKTNKFGRRILSFVLTAFLLSAAMALSLMTGIPFSELGLGITVSAEESTITPVTPQLDSDGFYSIGSAAELYGFAELVNSGNASANAKLTADIIVNENVLDANGDANTGDFVQWIPIGNDDQNMTYSGTFDGQGHTVSGLYVSGSGWFVGFIGEVSGSAVVKNLGIVDSYFSSSNSYLGSIVGDVSDNSSVTLANVYSTSTVKGDNWIGGLACGADGSVSVVNSYFAGKTIANFQSGEYSSHHDDLVAGGFNRSTLTVCNAFVLGTSQYGTSVTAGQLSDGTVAATLHYYQDALADGSMFGISDGKTAFSGSLEGVSVTTADITLHTFDGDATAYSSNYVVGNTTPLPVNVVRSGYKFAGWYDNADLEGDAVTSISSSETGNKEYWAKFERSHSVTFVLNDGYIQTGEIDHYIEGETTALPTMVFKNSASFEGWYTTEDFTGSRYYSIPSTATEDMAFYAKWGEAKTIFYLVQGGSPEPVNVLYEGENVVYLDKTTMDGYYVSGEYGGSWGGFNESVNVPYTGGESTFSNGGRALKVAQSGFYVFTLTDKGEGKWFVSVLYLLENYITAVADIPDQTYTGSAIEPEIGITTTLTLGTDYTITFSDNTNAGTAKATITGKGNYGGTIVKTFAINKATPTADMFNYSAPANCVYDGTEKSANVVKKDGITGIGAITNIKYYQNGTEVTPINAGTYTVKIDVADGKNYANIVGLEIGTFEITKANTVITWNDQTLASTGEEAELTAPTLTFIGKDNPEVVLAYSYKVQGDAEYTVGLPSDCGIYDVKVNVSETDNYNAVEDTMTLTITCTDENGDEYCDNCGVIYNGIGAHLAGYSVSLNGSIGVNFHMDLTQDVLKDNEAYMLFTLPNGTTQKVMVSDAKESAVIEGKTYYIFTCNVAAKEMTDTIQAQLITSDGSKTQVYEYSVREYADRILSGSYDDETKELVKAMLHYGAYSQEWFDYNTTNLANEGLDTLNLSEAADDWDEFNPSISNNDKVGSFTSAYLTLESDTAINLKFKLADGVSFEDLTFVVEDTLGNVVPVTTDTTENVCLITLTGIKASDLDTTYSFCVTDGKGNESVILYSAMSYACAVANSEMDQKLKDVTAALRIFNLRANEKFEH